jgi:drug/metabolite transporter (DMT)-like permease
MVFPSWIWIPLTVGAAMAQTLRNAAQRHLTRDLGAIGATLVRFLYGLPFAVLWLAIIAGLTGGPIPSLGLAFLAWTLFGSVMQIAGTALLLRVMMERNFALGVAYTKTEIVQVAVFGAVLLGDPVSVGLAASIAAAAVGVMLVSLPPSDRSLRAFAGTWKSRSALLGIASGGAFALAAASFRGSALALHLTPLALAAAYSVVTAQLMQSVLLLIYLPLRHRGVTTAVFRAWRVSFFAGFMGALASILYFTAMAIHPVAQVRAVALTELLFTYVVSYRLFRERLAGMEMLGLGLLTVGVAGAILL